MFFLKSMFMFIRFYYFQDVLHYFSLIFHYFEDGFHYLAMLFINVSSLIFQCFKDVLHYFCKYAEYACKLQNIYPTLKNNEAHL